MNNVEIVEIKSFNSKKFTLYLQIVLSILLLVFGIIAMFFNSNFIPLAYLLLSLVLFVMAWNNLKIHNRKYMTIVYILFGIVTLISFITELL